MHSNKTNVLLTVFAAAFAVVAACGEDGDSAGNVASPEGVRGDVGTKVVAAPGQMPDWLLEELRRVPQLPGGGAPQAIDDECCTEVGQADECWLTDAADDGIICPDYPSAPAGSPACLSALGCEDTNTLCECESDADCWDGAQRQGRCVIQAGDTTGLCGPSWCNGYKICSCWGGCIEAEGLPSENCADEGLSCCDGDYPVLPSLQDDEVGSGYCTDDASCGAGCANDGDCDDANACTVDDCIESTGECAHDDLDCDDLNECTDDACNVASGCYYTDNTDPCDADSNGCTVDDACVAGECTAGALANCAGTDTNPCTDEACLSTGVNSFDCTHTPNADPCNDSNACTDGDTCSGGTCVGAAITCDDANDCTDDDCNPASGCVFAPNTDPCDDGDACTTSDACSGGSCVGGPALDCSDANVCTNNSCDAATGCVTTFNTSPCNDSNACTTGDTCSMGSCVGTAVSCDDGNGCTNDSCDPASGCVHANNTLPCDDGSECTDPDVCSGGSCSGSPVDCDDSNGCTDDSCAPATGCVNAPNTNPCNDSNACTSPDQCSGGACVGGPAPDCDDDNDCTDDSCNPATGCQNVNNTASCDDSNACTTLDQCSGGSCVGGPDLDCSDANVCTNNSCNPATGCVITNNTVLCDDEDECTTGDQCSGGSCVGAAVVCNDGDSCTTDSCLPASGCSFTDIPACCAADSDCTASCPVGYSTQCATPRCVANACTCQYTTPGTECTDFDTTLYPVNCYTGFCGSITSSTWYPTFGVANGSCQPVEHAAFNNLCSDLFDQPAGLTIDTGHDGYLGFFGNDGTVSAGPLADVTGSELTTTGLTRCAFNNYESAGDDCNEWAVADDPIGTDGLDLVYVFEYETNSSDQFDLYSYLIKLEGNFDLGMYVMTDLEEAADCPEGNHPDQDDSVTYPAYHWSAMSSRCNYPYSSAPTVVEDYCDDTGNDVQWPPQTCCDPCADSSCYWDGYWWCERGYNTDGSACDMCSAGDCDGVWEYPQDPFNCAPESSYPAANMASAVIYPDGDTDGSTRRVFIFIDGVNADVGEFQISIERRKWYASPCDRVNDDARVFDFTHPGASGQTFLGSLDSVVNSMHSGSGSCGGYNCSDSWSGDTSCHDGSSPNKFWPNMEHFKIHRQAGEGSATYCVVSDESIAGAADLVVERQNRSDSSANTICDETYSSAGCRHDNFGSNFKYAFTADEGELYLIAISQYAGMNRPCLEALGDDCNYKLTVYEGPCPATCVGALETPAGASIEITAANWSTYTTVTRSSNLSGADGNTYYINGDDTEDEVFQLNNTSGNTVDIKVELCPTSGDAMIGLYNCSQDGVLAYKDDGGSGCETLNYSLPSSADPYYLTADTWDSWWSGQLGNYTMTVTWGTPACAAPLGTLAGEFWMSGTASPYVVNGAIDASNTNAYDVPGYADDKRDEVYVVHNDTGAAKNLSVTHTGEYGPVAMRTILDFYDCNNNYIKHMVAGSGCTVGVTDVYTVNSGHTVYVVADTHTASGCCPSNVGNYRITFSW